MTEQDTDEQLDLDLIEARAAHLYEYPAHAVDVEILAGIEVPALLEEVRHQRAELATYRALDLGDLDGRTSATCDNLTHPMWIRRITDARGCIWCRAVELSAERDEVTKQRDQARRIAVTLEQETARLEALLAEMTHCRDNALRALYRDDVDTDIDLEETIGAPFYGPGWDWDESDLQPVVREAANAVRPAFGKLTQQRDKAQARVAELEADLAKYVGHEPTIAEEMAYLSNSLDAVLGLCDKAEQQAGRWETPLPAPDWVAQVRKAAEGLAERTTYPPALSWAQLMDTEDLAEFLAELEHAIASPGATPNEALTAVEQACGTWRAIAEAQHAHNTAAGPDAEAGEGQ